MEEENVHSEILIYIPKYKWGRFVYCGIPITLRACVPRCVSRYLYGLLCLAIWLCLYALMQVVVGKVWIYFHKIVGSIIEGIYMTFTLPRCKINWSGHARNFHTISIYSRLLHSLSWLRLRSCSKFISSPATIRATTRVNDIFSMVVPSFLFK